MLFKSLFVVGKLIHCKNIPMFCTKTPPCFIPKHPHVLYQNIPMFLQLTIYNHQASLNELVYKVLFIDILTSCC